MSSVADPALAEALADARAALQRVAELGVTPTDGADAAAVVRELEDLGRRTRALQIGVVGEIDRGGLHKPDGHTSAKVMVRHTARLSDAEATRRTKASRVLRDLPAVAAAFGAGRIGTCHLDRIARTYANARVRQQLIDVEADLAVIAARLPYRDFDRALTDWERLTDQDGTRDRAECAHANRDFRVHTNFDGTHRFEGGCGSLQGAELRSILKRYTHAEWEADWAEARERLGDHATVDDLARTEAQRRMDAAEAIFRDAANHHAASPGGSVIATDIVIDHDTSLRELDQITNTEPEPDDRAASFFADLVAATAEDTDDRTPTTPAGYRCSTLDGTPIDPTEATIAALHHHIRRIVIGTDNVVLDMGRRTRLFTGPRQLAVALTNTTCYWPGCHTPVTHCQTDHLDPWAAPTHGPTNPRNGGPACPHHNRHKQHGYTVHRAPDGRWHTYRPDGTEIT